MPVTSRLWCDLVRETTMFAREQQRAFSPHKTLSHPAVRERCPVIEPFPTRSGRGDVTRDQVPLPGEGLPRRVCVHGGPDIEAAVVVAAIQGAVWMSITPPFTGHAVMAPRTVDEVIRALRAAQGEAEAMRAPGRRPRAGTTVVHDITKSPGAP